MLVESVKVCAVVCVVAVAEVEVNVGESRDHVYGKVVVVVGVVVAVVECVIVGGTVVVCVHLSIVKSDASFVPKLV